MTDRLNRLFLLIFLVLGLNSGCGVQNNQTSFSPLNEGECRAQKVTGRYLVEWTDGSVTVEQAKDDDQFISELVQKREKEVNRVEHDRIITLPQIPSPSPGIKLPEPEFSPFTHNEDRLWGYKKVHAPEVWEKDIKGFDHVHGESIVIALIDSGMDVSHPQLQHQVAQNQGEIGVDRRGNRKESNGKDDDGNGLIDDVGGWDFVTRSPLEGDYSGHGTHVAGIMVADPTESFEDDPLSGIAPAAKVLPLAFIDREGVGQLSDAIAAIDYAVKRGARVINASWGGSDCSAILRDRIQKLASQNVLIVVAAGNNASNIDKEPEYPAAFKANSQITVGASNQQDVMAFFSNGGTKSVHLMAPGEEIYSTFPLPERYAASRGTSMAAPFVSGAAALLWGHRPNASYRQVRTAILESVDRGPFQAQTRGRLNVEKAIKRIEELVPSKAPLQKQEPLM